MRLPAALLRIIIGFIVACLVAGVATVAFVVTPADIATLPAELRPDRLQSAGVLALLAATHSAIFALPFALIAVAIAEWQAIRSWIYYAVAGIAIALGGFYAEYLAEVAGQPTIINDYAARAFLTVGFLGGLAYWLVSGCRAGSRPADVGPAVASGPDVPEAEPDDEPETRGNAKVAHKVAPVTG
jgi:hypothetical protein